MPQDGDRQAQRRCAVLLYATYAVLAILTLSEKWGQTTNDTRLELTERPGSFLSGTFSLWHGGSSLGELQNQAYGYVFPQGSFFAAVEGVGMPGWLTQRLWSFLLLVLAAEGVRRVARTLQTGPWAAAAAGLVYALAPRMVAQAGLRSAEIVPAVVLPWALLPLLHLVLGRRRGRDAALLSAAAFACGGGVNGTATAAPAALLAIVVGWAVLNRVVGWRFVAGWLALMAAANAWWVVSLLRLGAYSPPFFDYVEDAPTTTSTAGFAESLRGTSSWIDFLQVGGSPWWPAGYQLAYSPWLVLGSGLVAALGLIGLLRYRGVLRTPLLLAAALGLLCQVAAHTGPLDGPLASGLQGLLDGALAPLRNIAKVDPVLRLPLAIGVAVVVQDLIRLGTRRRRTPRRAARRVAAAGIALALAGGTVAMATPVIAANTRLPGWTAIPAYWTDAAAYVAKTPGVTWVIPGSGFGIETWGRTMEEPMDAVARSSWVTRSQLPLAPAGTIRLLSQLESYLETGAGSPYLRFMLTRLGVTQILVRHDLDVPVAEVPSSSLVSVALARSPGITRTQSFGQLAFGPAIEVYRVAPVAGGAAQGYAARAAARAVAVSASSEDGLTAVGNSLVAPDQPMLLAGTQGWTAPADVVGDGYRRRERDFGRVHDAVSDVMTADEPSHTGRVLPDYPGPPGARPVVARYLGIKDVTASSSRAWADALGPVHPEDAPWSALDGDPATAWRPGPFLDPVGQWWQVDLAAPTAIGRVTLTGAGSWDVSAGGVHRQVTADAGGRATADLGGVVAGAIRVAVVTPPGDGVSPGLDEVAIAGVRAERTLVVPPAPESAHPAFLFSAAPDVRACVPTLLGPDCDATRAHPSEEATGIDRTFTVDTPAGGGAWRMRGLVVARSSWGTQALLRPIAGPTMTASSTYGLDPSVSARMAHDEDPSTEWISDPRDPAPFLRIDLGRARTLTTLTITPPSGVAVAPATARITTPDGRSRRVSLSGALSAPGSFAPLRTRRLTITFGRSPSAPPGAPLGASEVRLGGGHLGVPLDGAAGTGAICGYGPGLVVDGHRYTTRVSGMIGDVTAGGQLSVHPCGVRRWRLAAGTHRVRLLSTSQFQPVELALLPQHRPAAAATPGRSLSLVSQSDTRTVLRVGAGQDAIVSAPFNVNAGWQASVGGRTLTPITVDGWAQGWLLPRGESGLVVLAFTPQHSYVVGLVAGLVALAAVLLGAVWVLVRRRCGPARVPVLAGLRTRRPTSTVAALLAFAAGWVLAGPVVGLAAVAGVLLAGRGRTVLVLVGTTLVAAYVVTAVELADGPRLPGATIDLVVGAAVALGLAAAARRTP